MKNETKKNDGPACACGKGDLYEEWLADEKEKKEASEAPLYDQTGISGTSTDSAGKEE